MIKLDHNGTQKIKIFFGFGTVVQGFFIFLPFRQYPHNSSYSSSRLTLKFCKVNNRNSGDFNARGKGSAS